MCFCIARLIAHPRLLTPACSSQNPTVTVGLTLSTEPYALSASTHHPFYLVVTARILKTPQPESPITLSISLTPFAGLGFRSYTNIVRVDSGVTTYPGPHPRVPGLLPRSRAWTDTPGITRDITKDPPELKVIQLWPRNRTIYYSTGGTPGSFANGKTVVIPPPGKGVLSVKLEVPRDEIARANIKPGERYRVGLTDNYLGTDWYAFGDFQGRKLRHWEPPEEQKTTEELEQFDRDEGIDVRVEGDWVMGENAKEFAFVVEEDGRAGVVEFDVVE